MKNLQLLISVTISEFEVLRDSGVLRVDPSRLVVTHISNIEGYPPEVDAQLLAKLPEFLPSEDQSLLILAFQAQDVTQRSDEPISALISGRVPLSIRHCTHVFPLTARAHQILKGRLADQVILEDPLFEDLVESHIANTEKQASRTGAAALVEALIENHGEFQQTHLLDAMCDQAHPLRKFLDGIIRFTRHKPMPQEPVSGLRDLGGLLKDIQAPADEALLAQLAAWLRPNQEELKGFRKVYADQELIQLLKRITHAWNLPVTATGMTVYFHWRELALRAGGIDPDALSADCQELAGCLDGQAVVEALWLLGFSVGYEAVAPAYYRTLGEKHPFNPTGRACKRVTLLTLSPIEATASNVEPTPEPKTNEPEDGSKRSDEPKPELTASEPPESRKEVELADAPEEPAKSPEAEIGPAASTSENPDAQANLLATPEVNDAPDSSDEAADTSTDSTSSNEGSSDGDSPPEPAKQPENKPATKKARKSTKKATKKAKKATPDELFPDNP